MDGLVSSQLIGTGEGLRASGLATDVGTNAGVCSQLTLGVRKDIGRRKARTHRLDVKTKEAFSSLSRHIMSGGSASTRADIAGNLLNSKAC